MEKTLIKAEQLQHFYGDSCAVQSISLDLKQGDILGLLGPNGAGKSTTMKMLCGILPPHQGQVTINGYDLLEQPAKAKQQIGYLPEQPPLYQELKVSEYLNYSGQLRHIKKADLQQAAQTAMERCGLEQVKHKLISQLSKGYQQRVGIAQAIIHNPPVIILDEPTVGLDPIQIREIRQLISELGQEHGIILSTHILPEVELICNQVNIIHQGQLVYSDSMDALNQRQSRELIISMIQPPKARQFEYEPYVISATPLSHNRFKLKVEDSELAAQQLAISAVENDWGITELSPYKQTLESIFVSLTSGDNTTAEANT